VSQPLEYQNNNQQTKNKATFRLNIKTFNYVLMPIKEQKSNIQVKMIER